jgi:ubiquinol-cytochrome c reductase cytochrome b subunit
VIVILFIAGAQDVVANTTRISVGNITASLQIALLVAPPLAWTTTRRICTALGRRPPPEHTERHVTVSRTPSGGYRDEHRPDADEPGGDSGITAATEATA